MRPKKEILHVVVGAGFPQSFSNAVRSVLRHTSDDVLAIYNFVDERDHHELKALELDRFGPRLTLLARQNAPDHQKIGALFSANNLALELASGHYNFISLLQGDMQMVKPTPNRIELLNSVFSSKVARVFHVNTVSQTGSLHDGVFDEAWNHARNPSFDFSMGASCVGILKLDLVASEGFRFEQDEASTGEMMRERGYAIANLGVLQDLAYNPWPGTLRKGVRHGFDVQIGLEESVLHLIQKAPSEEPLQIGNRQVRNMAVPSGFRTLYPYWASDLQKTKWIPRRREAVKELGIGFFSSIDENGGISSYLAPSALRRSPGLGYFLWRVLVGYLQMIFEKLRLSVYLAVKNWLPSRKLRVEADSVE